VCSNLIQPQHAALSKPLLRDIFPLLSLFFSPITKSSSLMPAIPSTSGRLRSGFVWLLFLQAHRETDRFFAASGVHLAQSTSGQFHCGLHFKNINRISMTHLYLLNHTLPITLGNLSSINLVPIFRCSRPTRNSVYTRRVDPSPLDFQVVFHHTDIHI
jgi:hypothetical protein